jgi:hypothetical protein
MQYPAGIRANKGYVEPRLNDVADVSALIHPFTFECSEEFTVHYGKMTNYTWDLVACARTVVRINEPARSRKYPQPVYRSDKSYAEEAPEHLWL